MRQASIFCAERDRHFPAAVEVGSDFERAVLSRLETGYMTDLVDATYLLGLAVAREFDRLTQRCVEHAPDRVDVIYGLLWIVRAEWAEDLRGRGKAERRYAA